MQHKIQNKLLGFVRILEIFIAVLIAIAIIISALALIPDLWQFIGKLRRFAGLPGVFGLCL